MKTKLVTEIRAIISDILMMGWEIQMKDLTRERESSHDIQENIPMKDRQK